jgi:abortive infection bacteriophage resistance protein
MNLTENCGGLLFAAIEEVEIYLRAKFAYYHAHKYGVLSYMDAVNYNKRHRHDKFKELIEAEIKNNRKVLFIRRKPVRFNTPPLCGGCKLEYT